jgi:hypothetical protein
MVLLLLVYWGQQLVGNRNVMIKAYFPAEGKRPDRLKNRFLDRPVRASGVGVGLADHV